MTETQPRRRVVTAVAERTRPNVDLLYLELTEAIRNLKESHYAIGRIVSQLREAGQTFAAITQRLHASGITEVDESVLVRLASVYDYYCNQLDLCDKMREHPYSTLYEIQTILRRANAPRHEVSAILSEIKGMNRLQAVNYVKSRYGLDEEQRTEFSTLKLAKPVAEQFEEWKARLLAAAQTAGDNVRDISHTEAMEKLLAIASLYNHEDLVRLWREMHGEYEDEG